MTQKNLPLGDELWPMGEPLRPRFTQCHTCDTLVPQEVAVRTACEDYCSKDCAKRGQQKHQADHVLHFGPTVSTEWPR